MKKFGHYEVTAELGRGGMGVVYKGFEPSLNRKVAIKCLAKHLLDDKDLVERFTREAKATAALNDPNVIQIYFIGEEQGQPFFAMEYIEGMSLDDILKGGHTLSVKHAKNLLKQACAGLSAAHKIGLVHRDIKPANMMITKDGTLKIVDFGIARTREYGDKLTNTGEFVGTPGYLSPEVCIGKDVDARSDIFSLGIVFYEMLAGKVPFENDSPLGLMLEVVQSEIPDIRTLNNKVDKKTSYILNKMIAKSPDERYQSCSEIIRDLGNTVDNQSLAEIQNDVQKVTYIAPRNKISEQVTLPGGTTVTSNHVQHGEMQSSRSGKKWVLAATLFAVVAAGAIGYYTGYFPIPVGDDNQAITQDSVRNLTDVDSLNEGSVQEVSHNNPDTDDLSNSVEMALTSDQSEVTADNQENLADISNKNTKVASIGGADLGMTNPEISDENNSIESSLVNQSDIKQPVSKQLVSTYEPDNSVLTEKQMTPRSMIQGNSNPLNSEVSVNSNSLIKEPKAIKLDKGVVVIAFGDPAVANPIEKIIESELKQNNIKVMNELFIPGMKQLLENDGADLAALKSLIEKNGGQAMVIANVNYVGSQQLQYAGRTTELVNAQLDIDSYNIRTGDNIGNGYGSKISYTSLNATDQASDAVMQFINQLTESLKNKI